jgi:LppX/LprAFG-like lipoprotein
MTKKTLATLLATTALLAACAKGPAPVNPRDAVLDAMQAVYEAETVHQELEMKVNAAGESFSFSGVADVDNANQTADMTMDLGMFGGEMRMLMDEGVVYMKSPTFQDVAPTEWVRIDPSKLTPEQAAQVGGFGAGTTDPAAYAGLFAGVFDVKAAGEEEIDGVPTVHYRGTIDLTKVLQNFGDVVGEDVDAATKKQLEAAVDQFEALGIDDSIPFDIWIDEESLPRRMKISMDFGDLVPGSDEASMDMTVDYSNFGEPVEVTLPPESKVTDLTDVIATQGGGASDEGSGSYDK